MTIYRISNRFHPACRSLDFDRIGGRAAIGRLGFLGAGVPMLPEERREFERMETVGETRYIGISKVLEIIGE